MARIQTGPPDIVETGAENDELSRGLHGKFRVQLELKLERMLTSSVVTVVYSQGCADKFTLSSQGAGRWCQTCNQLWQIRNMAARSVHSAIHGSWRAVTSTTNTEAAFDAPNTHPAVVTGWRFMRRHRFRDCRDAHRAWSADSPVAGYTLHAIANYAKHCTRSGAVLRESPE